MNPTAAIILGVLVCTAAGCRPPTPCPKPITLATAGVVPAVDYSALDEVLSRALDRRGRVILPTLQRLEPELDRQLALLAVTGPSATPALLPNPQDQAAYWYNARAAWSLKLLARHMNQLPVDIERLDQAFPLDGQVMTLQAIDARLASWDDWRYLAAAPGITYHRARLPARALAGGDFPAAAHDCFNEFILDDWRFVYDTLGRKIVVPPVLWSLRARIAQTARCDRPIPSFQASLLPYVSGAALVRLNDAVGYGAAEDRAPGPPAVYEIPDRQRLWGR